MPTNFELKRLKPKLDIVKKPENRVHELTDSNVSQMAYSRFSALNFISLQRSNAEQNPLVRTFIIPQTIPLPIYSFNGLNCTSKLSI